MVDETLLSSNTLLREIEPTIAVERAAKSGTAEGAKVGDAIKAFEAYKASRTLANLNEYWRRLRSIQPNRLRDSYCRPAETLVSRVNQYLFHLGLPAPEIAHQASTSRQTPQSPQPMSPSNANRPLSRQFSPPAAQSPAAQSPAPPGEQFNANPPGWHRVRDNSAFVAHRARASESIADVFQSQQLMGKFLVDTESWQPVQSPEPAVCVHAATARG
jgi:hypothetical protein